jgi:adenylate cyclase
MTAPKESAAGLLSWLNGAEARTLDEAGLVAAFGPRLRQAGLPVDQLAALRWTLHPGVLAATMRWVPDRPVELYDREQGGEPAAAFAVTRLYENLAVGRPLSLHGEALALVAVDALRGMGLIEQFVVPCAHADGPFRASAFGTAQKGGFTAAEQGVLERVAPALAARLCAAGRRVGRLGLKDLSTARPTSPRPSPP